MLHYIAQFGAQTIGRDQSYEATIRGGGIHRFSLGHRCEVSSGLQFAQYVFGLVLSLCNDDPHWHFRDLRTDRQAADEQRPESKPASQ